MKKNLYLIKNIIKFILDITIGYFYDLFRFLRYSTTISSDNFETLEGRIMANAHVIEKGLSLKSTKIGFGKVVINNLIILLEKYIIKNYPINNFAFESGISALAAYQKFHKDNNINFELIDNFLNKNKTYIKTRDANIHITKKSISKKINNDFKKIVESRHSIRNFSKKPISIDSINKSIEIALNTPSVCNRQSWKTHLIVNKKLIKKVLNLQNGNRGFTNQIDKLLIISSSLRSFQGANERNQAFIDGGLFSMSLIYSLHYQNIGTCPLNWASTVKNDIFLKRELNISQDETIILMIALGSIKKDYMVAKSRRKSLKETLTIYK